MIQNVKYFIEELRFFIMDSFLEWISDKSNSDWWIYIKRLSGNDTGLSGGHQAGVYIPKDVIASVFPSINRLDIKNPDSMVSARVSSHCLPEQTVRAIYYNNKFHGGSRDEKRITRWKEEIGRTPLQDPEATGGLALFAFHKMADSVDADYIDIWVCRGPEDEAVIETLTGEIIPGQTLFECGSQVLGGFVLGGVTKDIAVALPEEWLVRFPSGEELIGFLDQKNNFQKTTPDELIIERREAEYSLFRKVEEYHVLDDVKKGFKSVDDFIKLANSVSNRRKSRSGRSLELHLDFLFKKFDLKDFETQCVTEDKKKPDFLFPSIAAYRDLSYPQDKLRMLAVKTTCKDRWRQVLNEADRIENIHLFTLQEGVSEHQFNEMTKENVSLVVPKPLHKKFPENVRSRLKSLEGFIAETIELYKD